jgi:hypothetical protein
VQLVAVGLGPGRGGGDVGLVAVADEDFRALAPLIHSHVNPRGTFEPDLKKRLPLEAPAELLVH